MIYYTDVWQTFLTEIFYGVEAIKLRISIMSTREFQLPQTYCSIISSINNRFWSKSWLIFRIGSVSESKFGSRLAGWNWLGRRKVFYRFKICFRRSWSARRTRRAIRWYETWFHCVCLKYVVSLRKWAPAYVFIKKVTFHFLELYFFSDSKRS